MWPFGKKIISPPPEDVNGDGMTAHYDVKLKHWIFHFDGVEFNLSGIPFNVAAFGWAREAAAIIRSQGSHIRSRVMECLEGWPCDEAKAEILSVDLDEYSDSKTFDIAFVGDESWGDFGVNVIIADGKIVDAYGGD
jgi:hypothetical protein